jgi:hypothetical protein
MLGLTDPLQPSVDLDVVVLDLWAWVDRKYTRQSYSRWSYFEIAGSHTQQHRQLYSILRMLSLVPVPALLVLLGLASKATGAYIIAGYAQEADRSC